MWPTLSIRMMGLFLQVRPTCNATHSVDSSSSTTTSMPCVSDLWSQSCHSGSLLMCLQVSLGTCRRLMFCWRCPSMGNSRQSKLGHGFQHRRMEHDSAPPNGHHVFGQLRRELSVLHLSDCRYECARLNRSIPSIIPTLMHCISFFC